MTILVTGFEAFDGRKTNASWETASALPSVLTVNGGTTTKISVRKLPVAYFRSTAQVLEAVESDPSITDIILLGEAGGIPRIRLEMIGVNVDDTSIPDNDGTLREGEPIDPDGMDGIFATIPVRRAVKYLNETARVPAHASWSAGQYLCNHVLYGVLNGLLREGLSPKVRVGFVHLPFTTEQASISDLPGLPVSELERGVEALLVYLIENPI